MIKNLFSDILFDVINYIIIRGDSFNYYIDSRS